MPKKLRKIKPVKPVECWAIERDGNIHDVYARFEGRVPTHGYVKGDCYDDDDHVIRVLVTPVVKDKAVRKSAASFVKELDDGKTVEQWATRWQNGEYTTRLTQKIAKRFAGYGALVRLRITELPLPKKKGKKTNGR